MPGEWRARGAQVRLEAAHIARASARYVVFSQKTPTHPPLCVVRLIIKLNMYRIVKYFLRVKICELLVLSVLDLRKFRAYKGYMVKDLLRAMRNKVGAIYRMFYLIRQRHCVIDMQFLLYI